jgi:hypothetical protein
MRRIGGAAAAASDVRACSLASGHWSRPTFFWASAMANARHVGCPHFLQFVLGSSLKISSPDNAIGLGPSH